MLERRTPAKGETRDPAAHHREGSSAPLLRPQVRVKGAPSTGGSRAVAGGSSPAPTRLASARTALTRRAGLSLSSPEVKLGLLLGSLTLFVLTLVLAPFGVVAGWAPLLALAAFAGVVVWLRRSATAARRVRAAASAPRRRAGFEAPVRTSQPAAPADATPEREVPHAAAASTKRSPLVAPIGATAGPEEDIFDQEPGDDAVARAEAEVFDGRNWAPVDVPRPTYTMKAKAEREEAAPAATVTALDARPLAARYENTPVEELPFDGMALDEDYDELPQVYRAG